MANLGQVFDSDQHEDIEGFDPIPANWYNLSVTKSEILETSKKTGKYIKLEFTVIDGQYKGRKIWENLNIINQNPIAVEIAQKALATLCRAVGKKAIADTQELHGIPLQGKVKIIPAKDDWPAKNGMVTYKPIEGEVSVPDFVKKTPDKMAPPEPEPKKKTGGVPWD